MARQSLRNRNRANLTSSFGRPGPPGPPGPAGPAGPPGPSPLPSVPQAPIPRLDLNLARASNAAQPLLLLLAVFGYFYTVLPAYQKELLGEQIAAKELELARLQKEISNTSPKIEGLNRQIHDLNERSTKIQGEYLASASAANQLESKRKLLAQQNLDLASKNQSLSHEVDLSLALADDIATRLYHDSFSMSASIVYLNSAITGGSIDMDSLTVDNLRSYLITPYIAITTQLKEGDSNFTPATATVPRAVIDRYHELVRTRLEAHKYELDRSSIDLHALIFELRRQLKESAIDPTPKDNFNEVLHETRLRQMALLHSYHKREMERTNEFFESLLPKRSAAVKPGK